MGCDSAASCGEGFQPEGGTCVPVTPPKCAEPCGAHETCDGSVSPAACECVTGYVGEPCTWGGAPRDPDFTDQTAWPDKTNGATVIPLTLGTRTGIASFERSVVCNAGAVSQVIDMPPYGLAEPFVVEITYRAENVEGVDVGFDRAFKTLPGTNGEWETHRFCLGDAAYGGSVKLQVASSERLADCFAAPIGTIEVDRLEILVAEPEECPEPGSVLNGEANVGKGGWEFITLGSATGSIDAGVGRGGSDGARIYRKANTRDQAAMTTLVSVPLQSSKPSPALRFWWKATNAWLYHIEIGTARGIGTRVRSLDTLVADDAAHIYTYCLPPWTHGNVVDLSFVAAGGEISKESELVVDDVEIISSQSCGDSADLLDPSFASSPNRWPGVTELGTSGRSVQIVDDEELSRAAGSGALEISYATNDVFVEMETWVWVPESDENGGPQLVLYSNIDANPQVPVRWLLGRTAVVNAELPTGGGWRRTPVCLPAQWANRWFRFRVRIDPSSDPLQVFDPPKRVLLDDFELGTDQGCPTE